MKSFINYIIESNKKQTVVYFPGSFKPPTKYHWDGVKKYSKMADKVIVVISNPKSKSAVRLTKNNKSIPAKISKKIFEIYNKTDELPNVEFKITNEYIPSPINFAIDDIKKNIKEPTNIILGTSDKDDDKDRFDYLKSVIKSIENNNGNIKFLNPKKYLLHKNKDNDKCATDARNHIDDYEYLVSDYIPDNLPEEDKKEIFNLLNPKQNKKPVKETEKQLESPRVGLKKINKLSNTKIKKMFKDIRDDLENGNFKLNITPKVDGQTVRLAWTNDKVYIESAHSGLVSDSKDLDLPQFKETLLYFQQQNIQKKLTKILSKDVEGYKVIGELLYNDKGMRDNDDSITFVGTKYDSRKLGSIGSIVIFDIKGIKNNSLIEINNKDEIIKYLVEKISNNEFSFFNNKDFAKEITLNINQFTKANQKNIKEIDNISKEDLISLKDEFNYILVDYCKEINKPEFVVSNKTIEGLVFKIGDTEYSVQNPEWLITKDGFYKYTNEFNDVLFNFIKDVTGWVQRTKIMAVWDDIVDDIKPRYQKLFPVFLKDLKVAYNNFKNNKKRMPKFVYINNKYFIDNVYDRFSKINSNINSFKKAIKPIKDKETLNESGHMFEEGKGTVPINQENVEATLESIYKKVLPMLNLKKSQTAVLGSTGKKLPGGKSGDVDLAIDITGTEYDDVNKFIYSATKLAKDSNIDIELRPGLKICSMRWPIVNKDGKQKNQFVQLDLMPTKNLKYIKWGMYSPAEKDYKYKGAVRNILMNAIASFRGFKTIKSFKDENGDEHPLVWERYAFSPNEGLKLLTKSRESKTIPNSPIKTQYVIDRKFVTNNQDEIIHKLLGKEFKAEDILTADDLFNGFKKTDLWEDQKIRDKIMAKTIKGLKENEFEYPKEFDNALKDKSLLENK